MVTFLRFFWQGKEHEAFAASATSISSISLSILFKFILQTFDTTFLILTFSVMKVVATGNRHTNPQFHNQPKVTLTL
jgi:hypothetical protein